MKAAVYYKYGSPDVLTVTETEKPSPRTGEVLIKVHAASLNAYDWHLLEANPFFTRILAGVFKPKNTILGADIAGVIVAAGNNAVKFKVGDAVYGCLEGCGKGGLAAGGFAEYVCARQTNLAPKPPELTFEEAAALPMASVTAMQAVRDQAKLTPGQSVLINGASGGVGLFAVQIAKALGAEVTGICRTESIETVRAAGADSIIDYKKEPVIGNQQYDAVIDVAATIPVAGYRRALKQNGRCIIVGFSSLGHIVSYNLAGKRDGKEIKLCSANNKNGDDLLAINRLVKAGQLRVFIDSCYPLKDAADAFRRIKSGHPRGKVIIDVD